MLQSEPWLSSKSHAWDLLWVPYAWRLQKFAKFSIGYWADSGAGKRSSSQLAYLSCSQGPINEHPLDTKKFTWAASFLDSNSRSANFSVMSRGRSALQHSTHIWRVSSRLTHACTLALMEGKIWTLNPLLLSQLCSVYPHSGSLNPNWNRFKKMLHPQNSQKVTLNVLSQKQGNFHFGCIWARIFDFFITINPNNCQYWVSAFILHIFSSSQDDDASPNTIPPPTMDVIFCFLEGNWRDISEGWIVWMLDWILLVD